MTDSEKLKIAIRLIAEWCVAIDENGGGWDCWDDYYKEAMHGKGPLREDIDAAMEESRNCDK